MEWGGMHEKNIFVILLEGYDIGGGGGGNGLVLYDI
jgi:hypothetical protein